MDIFESLENLEISEECFDDIMSIVEELLSESNRARRYGQKNTNADSKSVDIFGTKALKDSTQMNPHRESANLIQRRGSLDVGSVPKEGDHDKRYTTMGDPDTEKALKNKKAPIKLYKKNREIILYFFPSLMIPVCIYKGIIINTKNV